MKEFYKKQEFYYFIIPFIILVWVVTTATLAVSTAKSKFENTSSDYLNIQTYITTILTTEPDRLEYAIQKENTGKFDYTVVIDQFTKKHGIAISNYTLQSMGKTKKAKQTIQSANMTINSVDITTFTQFLSTLLQTWPELQCDTLSIDKLKGEKDKWKITMKFTYTFKN